MTRVPQRRRTDPRPRTRWNTCESGLGGGGGGGLKEARPNPGAPTGSVSVPLFLPWACDDIPPLHFPLNVSTISPFISCLLASQIRGRERLPPRGGRRVRPGRRGVRHQPVLLPPGPLRDRHPGMSVGRPSVWKTLPRPNRHERLVSTLGNL